jgi:hypothetical protein
MPWYATHYDAALNKPVVEPGYPQVGEYGSFVWAPSRARAEARCRRRGIGEALMRGTYQRKALPRPEPRASDLLRPRKMSPQQRMQAIHAATFVLGLWATANGRPAWDVLGDGGTLHEIIHGMSLGLGRRADFVERMRVIEREIPGYLSTRDR